MDEIMFIDPQNYAAWLCAQAEVQAVQSAQNRSEDEPVFVLGADGMLVMSAVS